MELDRVALCGLCDTKDPDREFVRNGTLTSVVLGGRRAPIGRPRAAATDGSAEPVLPSLAAAVSSDLLTGVAVERILAGISTRKYARANERMGSQVVAAVRVSRSPQCCVASCRTAAGPRMS